MPILGPKNLEGNTRGLKRPWMRIVGTLTLAFGALIAAQMTDNGNKKGDHDDAKVVAPASDHHEAKPDPLTLSELEEILPERMIWEEIEKILAKGLPCVDGRNPESIEGVPGGDAGVCLAVVGALENILKRPLTPEEVAKVVKAIPGTERMHTATHAIEGHPGKHDGLIDQILGDEVLSNYAKTPEDARRLMDEGTGDPIADIRLKNVLKNKKAIACGHMSLAAKKFEDYGIRPGLSEDVVGGSIERKWEKNADHDTVIEELPGDHLERAVVEVRFNIAQVLANKTRAPLLKANAKHGGQFFVLGSDKISTLRIGQIADIVVKMFPEVDRDDLIAQAVALFARHSALTASGLASGLPHFVVEVQEGNKVNIIQEGVMK